MHLVTLRTDSRRVQTTPTKTLTSPNATPPFLSHPSLSPSALPERPRPVPTIFMSSKDEIIGRYQNMLETEKQILSKLQELNGQESEHRCVLVRLQRVVCGALRRCAGSLAHARARAISAPSPHGHFTAGSSLTASSPWTPQESASR